MLVESGIMETGSGSRAEVPSTSPSLYQFLYNSLQIDNSMQPEDGDTGREGPGSEDGLKRLEFQHHEQNSTPLGGEGSKSEDDDGFRLE